MKITRTLIAITMSVATAIGAYADAYSLPQPPRRMIVAVGDFTMPDDTVLENAADLAQLRLRIQHRLIGTRKFEVVERQNLKQILSEIQLKDSGFTNPNNAPQDGQLLAAGYIIYGRVLFYAADARQAEIVGLTAARRRLSVELQLKIADAETGRILADKIVRGESMRTARISSEVAVAGETRPGDGMMRDAVEDAAAQAVDQLRDLCYPAKIIRVDDTEVTANMTSEEVSEGDIFTVYANAEPIFDPDTGVYLGTEGKRIGRLRVDATGPMTSKLVPVGGVPVSGIAPGCILHRVSNATLNRESQPANPTPPTLF